MRLRSATQHAGYMKVVNYATYASIGEMAALLRPAHREYMTQLHAEGRLVAYGPFADGSGALFIYEASSLSAAEELLASDPYQVGGVFASCRLCAWEIVKANPDMISPTQALS